MNKLYEYMNKIDDKRSLKEAKFRMTPELWDEIKAYADHPRMTGRRFAYEGEYDYEVSMMYAHALELYNKKHNDTLSYWVNTVAGYGTCDLMRKDGTYVEIDYPAECDYLLQLARKASSYQEFMRLLLWYIGQLAKQPFNPAR